LNNPYNPVKNSVTPDFADGEVASRRRAPKATFRRFDVLFIVGAVLAWCGYLVWSWWL
jgi:hypothetical protein